MSSTPTPTFKRQEAVNRNDFLIQWLQEYKLEHLYEIVSKSRINIEELCECDEEVIQETAKCKLNLEGDDLSLFVTSLVTYNNLQCLTKRNLEVSSCINSLEYTKNELSIKQSNDVLYVQEKFKKIMKTLKKRENILIRDMSKKSQNKVNLLNEQILHLNEYKTKLEQQYDLLSIASTKVINVNVEPVKDENINTITSVLLNESIQYDKDRFATINNMSVEIPNYDDIISQIKRTGIIADEFNHFNDNDIDKIDDKLDCLCGTQLILTKVMKAYDAKHKIYCNFCNNFCNDNVNIYHCPRGDIKLHPGGFDLCYFCGSRCFEARKADKRREKEEIKKQRQKQRKRKAMSNGLDKIKKTHRYRRRPNAPNAKVGVGLFNNINIRHNRSHSEMKSSQWEKANVAHKANFVYSQQLQQLTEMGYDYKKSKKLLLKHSGNLTKALGELM